MATKSKKSKTQRKPVVRGKARATKKTAKRMVLYSRSGKKLYAKRSKTGTFTDIQSYQRAHSADLKRTSKAERAGRARKSVTAKKPAATKAKVGATRKAKVVKAVVAKAVAGKKPVARKSPAAAAKSSPSPRIVRAAMTVKQIPRAQQSYAVMPKPVAAERVIEEIVELGVPDVVVSASVQGEVPAGGE